MTNHIMKRYVSDYKIIAVLSIIVDILICASIIFYFFAPLFEIDGDGLFSGMTYSLMDNVRIFVDFLDFVDISNFTMINILEITCILFMILSIILATINAVKEILFLVNVDERIMKKHSRLCSGRAFINYAGLFYFSAAIIIICFTILTKMTLLEQETLFFGLSYNRDMIEIFAIMSVFTIIFNCICIFFKQRIKMYIVIETADPSYSWE